MNSLYESAGRYGEVVIVEFVLVFAGIGTIRDRAGSAVHIRGDQAIIGKGIGWVGLVAITVSCTGLS